MVIGWNAMLGMKSFKNTTHATLENAICHELHFPSALLHQNVNFQHYWIFKKKINFDTACVMGFSVKAMLGMPSFKNTSDAALENAGWPQLHSDSALTT